MQNSSQHGYTKNSVAPGSTRPLAPQPAASQPTAASQPAGYASYGSVYNAPKYNDPNSPMSKVPMALDDSLVNDSIYSKKQLVEDFGRATRTHIIPQQNNKLLQGASNSTIISSDYYATGQKHILTPPKSPFDSPDTFQLNQTPPLPEINTPAPAEPAVAASQPTPSQAPAPDAALQSPKPLPQPAYGSVDYLNSIAPNNIPDKKPINSRLFVFGGIGAVVVIVAIAVMAALSNKPNSALAGINTMHTTASNIQGIIKFARKNRSILTREENDEISELMLTVSSEENTLAGAIGMGANAKGKYKRAKFDPKFKSELESALAKGTAADEMPSLLKQQLDKLISTAKNTVNHLKTKKQKDAVNEAINNLSTVAKRLNDSIQAKHTDDTKNSAAKAVTERKAAAAVNQDQDSSESD